MAYQEYPKWVDTKEGAVLVHSAEEEAKLTGKSQASLEKQAAENEKEEDKPVEELEAELEKKLVEDGPAVTEPKIAELNDLADKIRAKRGPGRPKKDEKAK